MTIEDHWAKFWRAYEAGQWEPGTKALLEEILRPGDLFVDIGAWIGPVSLWALELGARVIAIEPDPVALPELKRRLPGGVEIWEGAVALDSGHLYLSPRYELGDSMTRIAAIGTRVPAWPLPEILNGRKPKLAVVDVEGYELELLPTVAPYLASLSTTLMVALHTELPDPAWFEGYGHVDMPASARDKRGRSLSVVARP